MVCRMVVTPIASTKTSFLQAVVAGVQAVFRASDLGLHVAL